MDLSYDPPEPTLGELMAADLDEIEGPPNAEETTRALHTLLSDRHVRHTVHLDKATGEITMTLPVNSALLLGALLDDNLKERCTVSATREMVLYALPPMEPQQACVVADRMLQAFHVKLSDDPMWWQPGAPGPYAGPPMSGGAPAH
ncbi:hypothetical protein ACWD26_29495 [Streptomyces sp. NPDC002787]